MALSSDQLDAFFAVAQTGSFTKAATRLYITQPAVSQRVLNLEQELETSLFVRERQRLRLTDAGAALLRYCQLRESLETELVGRLRTNEAETLTGALRIAGFSSVTRSIVLPAISNILHDHPGVTLHLLTRELKELPELLRSGEADFVIHDRPVEAVNVRSIRLGDEENVLVEHVRHRGSDAYLDHDEHDLTTQRYFELTRKPFTGRRHFMDDVYGVLDGVRNGIGRAVLSRHLLKPFRELRIVNPSIVLRTAVVLNFYEAPYSSQLHQVVVRQLTQEIPRLLAGRA